MALEVISRLLLYNTETNFKFRKTGICIMQLEAVIYIIQNNITCVFGHHRHTKRRTETSNARNNALSEGGLNSNLDSNEVSAHTEQRTEVSASEGRLYNNLTSNPVSAHTEQRTEVSALDSVKQINSVLPTSRFDAKQGNKLFYLKS